jgi:hypothetical protein
MLEGDVELLQSFRPGEARQDEAELDCSLMTAVLYRLEHFRQELQVLQDLLVCQFADRL